VTLRLFAVSLFAVVAATATPTFTDTGSAATSCFGQGTPLFTISATGSTIDLACPPPNSGAEVRGFAGNLFTQVSIGRPWIPGLAAPSFSFQSSMADTIIPAVDTTVEFTATYNWQNIGDDGVGVTAGDLLFNGQTIWSRSDLTCLFGQSCWDQAAFHHVTVAVIDEPVSAGVPFSYQADVSSSSAVPGSFFPGESNNMTVSVALLATPEPSTCLLVLFGLAVLWSKRPFGDA
jgi:hypothetical protein